MELELSVAVAAVLEAKSLELVVAGRQHRRVGLQVAPRVARGVLRAVNTDERPEAVVGVHAEREDTSHVVPERNPDVEPDVAVDPTLANVLVAQVRR